MDVPESQVGMEERLPKAVQRDLSVRGVLQGRFLCGRASLDPGHGHGQGCFTSSDHQHDIPMT